MAKARILYVEDDSTLGPLLQKKLTEAGYEAQLAADGEAGVAAAEKGNFDLILLDIILPKMDGFAVLKHLRESEATKKVPVLILSNLDSQEDFNKSREMGAESFLVKASSDPKQILDAIDQLLAFRNL